jgi:hypothetical protein
MLNFYFFIKNILLMLMAPFYVLKMVEFNYIINIYFKIFKKIRWSL